MGTEEIEGKGASVLEFTDLTPNGKPAVRTSKMHLETTAFLVVTWEQENNKRKSCPQSHQPYKSKLRHQSHIYHT